MKQAGFAQLKTNRHEHLKHNWSIRESRSRHRRWNGNVSLYIITNDTAWWCYSKRTYDCPRPRIERCKSIHHWSASRCPRESRRCLPREGLPCCVSQNFRRKFLNGSWSETIVSAWMLSTRKASRKVSNSSLRQMENWTFLLTSKPQYVLIHLPIINATIRYSAGIITPLGEPEFVAKKLAFFTQDKIPYELESFEGWHSIFKINTYAPFFVTSAFLELLEKGARSPGNNTSSVINISSTVTAMSSILPQNSVCLSLIREWLKLICIFFSLPTPWQRQRWSIWLHPWQLTLLRRKFPSESTLFSLVSSLPTLFLPKSSKSTRQKHSRVSSLPSHFYDSGSE